jgi:hypothetical protein
VGLELGRLGLVSITEELLEWKSNGSGSRKSRLTIAGIRCADHAPPSVRKVGTNSDKRRLLGPYSSLADESHGVYFLVLASFGFENLTPRDL